MPHSRSTTPPAIHPAVNAQYEALPYPPRDPAAERARLLAPAPDCLDYLCHHGFAGKLDIRRPFRVLVAGGGTGDSVIFLAEQLRHHPAEIHYVDMSQASMQVARERAAIRGLSNIHWHHASLLDVAALGIGPCDYINCSGVLHHLPDPAAGLRALRGVLHPSGVMGLMLYGAYGRRGVYVLQNELRRMLPAEATIPEKIRIARDYLAQLPPEHPFAQTAAWFNDIRHYGDAGLYDLLLHAQDRAYTVPEIYTLLNAEQLHLQHWIGPVECGGNGAYRVENTLTGETLEAARTLPQREQEALAERTAARIIRHTFYVTHTPKPLPDAADREMVASLPITTDEKIYAVLAKRIAQAKPGETLTLRSGDDAVTLNVQPWIAEIAQHLNGQRSLKQIHARMREEAQKMGKTAPTIAECAHAFGALYAAMNGTKNHTNWLLLRHASLPAFTRVEDLQRAAFDG